jgi:hypothetical protein
MFVPVRNALAKPRNADGASNQSAIGFAHPDDAICSVAIGTSL